MLFQVGGQGTRPTFFEMAAAQQLPASLRAAITYSVGVMALRRPILHKVLDYEDEFFALLMLVLEAHSMRTTDASFSESLYGLRRRAVKTRLKKDALHGNTTDGIQHSGLEKHQKVLSVVFLAHLCRLHYHILSQSCIRYIPEKGKLHSRRGCGDQVMKDLMTLTL